MAKASPTVESPLVEQLHSLAAYVPSEAPVVSLYLSLTPDTNGRDAYDAFCRRVFSEALAGSSSEEAGQREALTGAFGRIESYLAKDVNPSANGLAIFASAGPDELFETVQLAAPIDAHSFFVGPVPHLYPLARLIDQNPRYAALLLDSNQARIIVFGLGEVEAREDVTGEKTRRHSMGGWSQARYQRRAENAHLQHVKEVVETLDTIVRAEEIQHVIVAGDEVIVARLREQLPANLAEKLVDVLRLDRRAGEEEIIAEALEALRRKDAEDDAQRVDEVLGAWRGRGLGVAGPEGVLRALQQGQVDELLISAAAEELKAVQRLPDDAASEPTVAQMSTADAADSAQMHLADELVTRAAQTGARVRMIENPELLRKHGGVAASLRFRIFQDVATRHQSKEPLGETER